MDKIPEDIRETSYKVAADIATSRFKTSHLIARAILAERKRCVEAVHRAAKDFYGNPDQMYAAARIAKAIEAGA